VNLDGHLQALAELQATRRKLDPVADHRTYVENGHGIAIHAVAAGALRRYGVDLDRHQGMARWLREHGHPDVADAVEAVERLRTAHWYGGQGDGDTAHRLDRHLKTLEAWAVA
jgi:hypothetical protein